VQLQTTWHREAGVEVREYGVGVVAAHQALVNVVPDVVSQPDRIRVGAKEGELRDAGPDVGRDEPDPHEMLAVEGAHSERACREMSLALGR